MKTDTTTKVLLVVIALGIWMNIFVTAGSGTQDVRVVNSVDVSGSVDANVGNTVDINIEAINGQYDVFYDINGSEKYHRLPVYTFGY